MKKIRGGDKFCSSPIHVAILGLLVAGLLLAEVQTADAVNLNPSGGSTFADGSRADAINLQTKEILELKPNNPEAIAQGNQQLQQYIQQAQKQFGGNWTGRVVTY